ncbi:hypothetical protein RUND412_004513 [Rhizina undulata]
MEFFMNNYGPATLQNPLQVNQDPPSPINDVEAPPDLNTVPPLITPQQTEYYQTLSYESMQAFRKLYKSYHDLQARFPELKVKPTVVDEDIESFLTQFQRAPTSEMRLAIEVPFIRVIGMKIRLVKAINEHKQELCMKDKQFKEQRGKLMEALEYYCTHCCCKDDDYVKETFKELFGEEWQRDVEISSDEDELEIVRGYRVEADEINSSEVDSEIIETDDDMEEDEFADKIAEEIADEIANEVGCSIPRERWVNTLLEVSLGRIFCSMRCISYN